MSIQLVHYLNSQSQSRIVFQQTKVEMQEKVAKRLMRYSCKKYLLAIFIALLIIFIFTTQSDRSFPRESANGFNEVYYLINTTNCKIPNIDPFNDDIIKYIVEEKPYKCSKYDLLTYIDKSHGVVTLHINKSLLNVYSVFEINCCYSNITRVNYEFESDNEIRFTDCIPFESSVNLTYPYVKVQCRNKFKEVYANVHAATLPVAKKTTSLPEKPKFSVLLLGIDSVSRWNLQRNMPKTYNYVENRMDNLKGYNKVEDNTFPNLMAMLTGYSLYQLREICNTSIKLNYCHFIWDKFKESNYITAYAEDECDVNTFNYDRPGFREEPTDVYYHPYLLAAEDLSSQIRHSMVYCSGPETSGDRILNAAKDFVVTYKDVPTFGLFWTNSFSHDDINMPAVMDDAFLQFLTDPEFVNAIDETILIFFSDHGFRFGDFRYTDSGWLEERLPFIYVHIPLKFRNLFPAKYQNLLTNTERLTTPYDVFHTLQDILEIGNASYTPDASQGCPKCSSLFTEVAENRSCDDVSIPLHYCTCKGHTYIDRNTPLVQSAASFAVKEINNIVKSFVNGDLCSVYSFRSVYSVGVSETYINSKNQKVYFYMVVLQTQPQAMFEATVEVYIEDGKATFTLLGDVSRLDRYAPVTKCITDNNSVKKYCYCSGLFNYLESFIPLV